MAVKTQAQLLADIATYIADNTTGDISASDVRQRLIDIVDSAAFAGKKVYKALLTQSGTSAPVATVLVNTLSGTPVWSRGAAGTYRATLTGEFPDADKFYISGMIITAVSNLTFIPISDAGSIVGYYTLYRESANVITMETYDNTFSVVEFSTLLGGAVKLALPTIEVYP